MALAGSAAAVVEEIAQEGHCLETEPSVVSRQGLSNRAGTGS